MRNMNLQIINSDKQNRRLISAGYTIYAANLKRRRNGDYYDYQIIQRI